MADTAAVSVQPTVTAQHRHSLPRRPRG